MRCSAPCIAQSFSEMPLPTLSLHRFTCPSSLHSFCVFPIPSLTRKIRRHQTHGNWQSYLFNIRSRQTAEINLRQTKLLIWVWFWLDAEWLLFAAQCNVAQNRSWCIGITDWWSRKKIYGSVLQLPDRICGKCGRNPQHWWWSDSTLSWMACAYVPQYCRN